VLEAGFACVIAVRRRVPVDLVGGPLVAAARVCAREAEQLLADLAVERQSSAPAGVPAATGHEPSMPPKQGRLRGQACMIVEKRETLAATVAEMGKEMELRRHTDADGDVLTAEGVTAALEIGARLRGGYHLAVSTGAQRATQTLACFVAALGQRLPGGVVVEPGLRSQVEDRWRAAYQKAGSGALDALRDADPELVAEDSERLGAALGRVLDGLPDGACALVVGHSPTNEAAVLGLTGEIVAPLGKGAGVRVVAGDGDYEVEPLA
jgi:broad specificity phosphatase PhoE